MRAFRAFFEYLDQRPRLRIGALVVHTVLYYSVV